MEPNFSPPHPWNHTPTIIRMARKYKISNREIADFFGIEQVSVARWELGHNTGVHPSWIRARIRQLIKQTRKAQQTRV